MIRSVPVLLLLVLLGCRNNTSDVAVADKKAAKIDDDKTPVAFDIFRQAVEPAQFRDALNLLSTHLTRPDVAPRLALKAEDRDFLKAEAQLSPAELGELDASYFRPIDAVHVSSAALFRDAAHSLEIAGLSELAQAEFAFDWVARRVLLYEQRYDGLPPAYVLRAGHGSAANRGLVFLALVHQFRLEGCLLSAPGATDAPLVGVLVGKKLRLFDTRLGLPVPGPGGKGIAAWDEVVKDPALLKDSKISPEQIAKLEGRMGLPLDALAPRMKYLEALLQGEEAHIGSDRLAVFHDALQLSRDLRAAGLEKIGVWAPVLRAQRQFASVDDGGADKNHRRELFAEGLLPWPPIIRRYQELRIYLDLPLPAQKSLLAVTRRLLDKYDREPGEMLIRGKIDLLPRRLERIRSAVEDAEFATQQEPELVKQAAIWRERVNKAYLALLREGDGGQQVSSIWEEDQYLGYLLQPELEDVPRGVTKKILSRLILSATREPLGARANWLFASLSQDKAERLRQAWIVQKEAGKDNKTAATNVKNAWVNARSAWTKYLDRNNLGPNNFALALPKLPGFLQIGEAERALGQWEYLQRELHQYASARVELARAMEQTGQNSKAVLEQLAQELDQLLKDEGVAKLREAALAAGVSTAPDGQNRWAMLGRDWGPEGNLAWMLETVRLTR
jgi:hypothetical protein